MKHSIQTLAAAAITAALIITTAQAAGPTKPAGTAPATARLNSSDHAFLSDAMATNQLDIDVSNYAAKQASSDKVRQFAQAMVAEHGKIAGDLQKANDGLVVSPLPMPQPGINLQGRSGAELDRAYVALMADYEHDAVGKFKSATDGPQYSATIRDMAKRTLPALQRDAATAMAMKRSLK